MAHIKIEKILSVSSEDTSYPAENLLIDGKNKKWKCKTTGEKKAIVILQFEKASRIRSIDVGNENSAFIEILVGKSCFENNEYKVLLVMSSLMTLKEAKDGTNANGVRFFKESDFCKPEVNDKWDLVKVVCSQPYNKHCQFGISFIKFHGGDESIPAVNKPILGRFVLKEEQEENISVGSLFARRKELTENVSQVKTSAAMIRAASLDVNDKELPAPSSKNDSKKAIKKRPQLNEELTPSSSKQKKDEVKKEHTIPQNKKETPSNTKMNDYRKIQTTPTNRDQAPTPTNIAGTKREKLLQDSQDTPAKKRAKNGPTTAMQNQNNKLPTKVKRTFKPFNKFMDRVVFVISGFQNPLRSDIRNKGIAMGAKYKADWDRSCTHLICAFPNTPKFNQVRGQGKIVKKDWIEECYSSRILKPWRRFALDRADIGQPESDEEIYEERNDIVQSDNRRRVNSSGSEDETPGPSLFNLLNKEQKEKKEKQKERENNHKNDVQNKSPVITPQKGNHSRQEFSNSDEEMEEPYEIDSKATKDEDSEMETDSLTSTNCVNRETMNGPESPPFPVHQDSKRVQSLNGDVTDSDPEWNSHVAQTCYPFPYLSQQFEDLTFYVMDSFNDDTKQKLTRYITAHSGVIVREITSEVEYAIAEDPASVSKLKEEFPQIVCVKEEWVWRCHDENRLLPTSKFEI